MADEILVELYSKDDCHLCDVAKDALLKVQKHHPFHLVEIKIQPGTGEYERFRDNIPVIFVNKQFAFQYKVPEAEFLQLLTRKTA